MCKKTGTSLLEIIIALFIMAAAMIPIAHLIGFGGSATQKDNRQIHAIQVLERTMRLLLQQPFQDIPIGANLTAYATPPVQLGTVPGPHGATYQVFLTCENVSPIDFRFHPVNVNRPGFSEGAPLATDFQAMQTLRLNDCVKKLSVRIDWIEQGNRTISFQAVSFRANLDRRGSGT
jgi:hypothetical protein